MSAGTSKPSTTWRPPPQGAWKYTDYLHLPDNGFRYELLEGDLYMSPAPSPRHQLVLNAVNYAIMTWLRAENRGKIIPAPVDVWLDDNTLVQPDLVVVLQGRLHIVTETVIKGSPDLAVETLSPSTERNDRGRKFVLYARYGVKEYWIVDAEAQAIEVHVLRGEAYSLLAKFKRDQKLESEVLLGFSLDPAEVFTV
jgi:Uma2 family endonuclease